MRTHLWVASFLIHSSSMFRHLPEDLCVALLSEWLKDGLIDLSQLDVACCNRASRRSWLQVLRRVRIKEADAGASACSCLSWLHDRDVLVSKLSLGLGKEDVQELSKSLRIRTTWLDCHRTLMHATPTLLPLFPNLTSLELLRVP